MKHARGRAVRLSASSASRQPRTSRWCRADTSASARNAGRSSCGACPRSCARSAASLWRRRSAFSSSRGLRGGSGAHDKCRAEALVSGWSNGHRVVRFCERLCVVRRFKTIFVERTVQHMSTDHSTTTRNNLGYQCIQEQHGCMHRPQIAVTENATFEAYTTGFFATQWPGARASGPGEIRIFYCSTAVKLFKIPVVKAFSYANYA